MNSERSSLRAAVYLIAEQNDQVLMHRRFNTGWEDGKYQFVSGHIDGNETVKEAMIREAKEEIGINIHPDNLRVVHTMHRKSNVEYIDFFLHTTSWDGVPSILEPDRADDLGWYEKDKLPENTLQYIVNALNHMKNGVTFSEEGFDNE